MGTERTNRRGYNTIFVLALSALFSGCGDSHVAPDGGSMDSGLAVDAGADAGADSGAPRLPACQEACTADSDCTIGGEDRRFRCDATTHRCEPLPCDEAECRAKKNLWTTACTGDADCAGEPSPSICVEGGVCAPSSTHCSSGQRLLDVTRFPSGEATQVCGLVTRCFMAACVVACPFTACPANYQCDEGTGRCVCANDAACPAGHRCDVASQQCRCDAPSSCGEGRVCRDGDCFCTDDRACESGGSCDVSTGQCACTSGSACSAGTFDGTRAVCE